MEMKSRGMTLTELVVYMALSSMVLGLIVSLFTVAKRTQRHTYTQFLMGGRLASAVRVVKQDLKSTALSSIRVFPDGSGGDPGMSLISAYDSKGKFTLGSYGSPLWQKHVYYHLDKNGLLVRWKKELSQKDGLPVQGLANPSELAGDKHPLTEGLLPPNVQVGDFQEATPFGGFEVGFVRRTQGKDTVVTQNPRDSKDFESHTRLVQVTFHTLEDQGKNPTYSRLVVRVCPRY